MLCQSQNQPSDRGPAVRCEVDEKLFVFVMVRNSEHRPPGHVWRRCEPPHNFSASFGHLPADDYGGVSHTSPPNHDDPAGKVQ